MIGVDDKHDLNYTDQDQDIITTALNSYPIMLRDVWTAVCEEDTKGCTCKIKCIELRETTASAICQDRRFKATSKTSNDNKSVL